MGYGVVRSELKGFLEASEGFVELPLHFEQGAEVGKRIRVVGFALKHFAVAGNSAVKLTRGDGEEVGEGVSVKELPPKFFPEKPDLQGLVFHRALTMLTKDGAAGQRLSADAECCAHSICLVQELVIRRYSTHSLGTARAYNLAPFTCRLNRGID